MLRLAMFLGPDYRWPVLAVAIVLLGAGSIWVHRVISGIKEPDKSYFRSQRRRGVRARLPSSRDLPTRGWLLTRGAIALGICGVAFAVAGPLVIRRWSSALDDGPMAAIVWATGVAFAVIGTVWMLRIAAGPEHGAPTFRYRSRP